MEGTTHILADLRDFDNRMFCGNINSVWWIGEFDLDFGDRTLGEITCEDCKDAYALYKLGDLP